MTEDKSLGKRIEDLENRVKKLEESSNSARINQDELFETAKEVVSKYTRVSSALLQRTLRIGYARAARLLDELEENGIVSSAIGAEPREVLKK